MQRLHERDLSAAICSNAAAGRTSASPPATNPTTRSSGPTTPATRRASCSGPNTSRSRTWRGSSRRWRLPCRRAAAAAPGRRSKANSSSAAGGASTTPPPRRRPRPTLPPFDRDRRRAGTPPSRTRPPATTSSARSGVSTRPRPLPALQLPPAREPAATKDAMRAAHPWVEQRWPDAAHTILIEKSANGVEIIAELKRELPGVLAVTVSTDKITRAIAAAPPSKSGNVFVPGRAAPDTASRLSAPEWVAEPDRRSRHIPERPLRRPGRRLQPGDQLGPQPARRQTDAHLCCTWPPPRPRPRNTRPERSTPRTRATPLKTLSARANATGRDTWTSPLAAGRHAVTRGTASLAVPAYWRCSAPRRGGPMSPRVSSRGEMQLRSTRTGRRHTGSSHRENHSSSSAFTSRPSTQSVGSTSIASSVSSASGSTRPPQRDSENR